MKVNTKVGNGYYNQGSYCSREYAFGAQADIKIRVHELFVILFAVIYVGITGISGVFCYGFIGNTCM